jgi:hypothetical protein
MVNKGSRGPETAQSGHAAFCLNNSKDRRRRRLTSFSVNAVSFLPIARSSRVFRSTLAQSSQPHPALGQACPIAGMTGAGMILKNAENAQDGTSERHGETTAEMAGWRLKIVSAEAYVRRMTATANEGRSLACQGLHNAPVLAYVSSHTVHLTVVCHP